MPIPVSDTESRIGIPSEEQAQLFRPFERASHAEVRLIEGSGLGLAITKGLVEAHGGKISLESKVDEGTRVTVTLPAPATVAEELGREPEVQAA